MAKNKKDKNEIKKIEEKNSEVNLQELKDYINEKIKNTFNEELDKANKRLIREKNKKIIFRNIIIIILLAIIGFLLFIMYRNNYFNKYFKSSVQQEIISDKKEEDTPKEPTLNELKLKYDKILDPYVITSSCDYKNDLYEGNLSNELKKYMTLNSINFKSIENDDYNIISEETFKKVFDTLFTSGYEKGEFKYNGNEIRYINSLQIYMSTSILKKDDYDIVREIIKIEEKDNYVFVTTIEGILKENHLYNVLTLDEIDNYDKGTILNYQDKLNKITYKFQDSKLISIEK